MTYKGVVKGNVVILEEGAHLPNGTTVLVTVAQAKQGAEGTVGPEELDERRALIAQMRAFGQKLVERNVNLGDLILEGKEELENRA
jgi:hypothetical protein